VLALDAWFDVTTAPPGAGLAAAVALALFAELPMSALCAAIAWHSWPLDPAQPRP
jgi:hypothetical protein